MNSAEITFFVIVAIVAAGVLAWGMASGGPRTRQPNDASSSATPAKR